ncbi:MAG: tetratricopeptide repeat protein, partial [Nitrospinota bacterium]
LSPYFDLAAIYSKRREFASAKKKYEKVIEANPNLLPPHVLLGVINELEGSIDAAIKNYERALDIDPKFAPAANNLAWIYSSRKDRLNEALSLAETAKEQRPEDPNISDTLGWIYYKKKVYLKAISLFNESIEKKPEEPVTYYHLGMAYFKKGDNKKAQEALKKSLAIDKNHSGHIEVKRVLDEIGNAQG